MGKSLLLTVAAALVATMGVMSQLSSSSSKAQTDAEADASKVLAREIAFTGLSTAKQKVFTDYEKFTKYHGPSQVKGDYNQGKYGVQISAKDSSVVIEAVGKYNGIEHNIVQTYEIAPGLPPFMWNAITCGIDMNINSGVHLDTMDPTLNASLFANKNFNVDNTSYVEGFGYYGVGASVDLYSAAAIFKPNYNPEGLPVIQAADPLKIPFLNPNKFKKKATKKYTGNLTLGGNYTLGTRKNPTIWYVEGNLSTNADVNFTGYGIILVNGKANISDDFVGSYAGGESTIALYADDGIIVSAKVNKVTGQWFSNGSTTISGNVHFYGSITMGSAYCNFAKSFNMTYIPASAAISKQLWKDPRKLQLVASHEW